MYFQLITTRFIYLRIPSDKFFLSNHGMNIFKYEKEKSLIIADALERYFGNQRHLDVKSFKVSLVDHAKQIGKNGLSILTYIGACPHRSKYNELLDHGVSLPTKFGTAMKGFCLYHQKDFDKFSDEQKQKLVEHHGKAIKIM